MTPFGASDFHLNRPGTLIAALPAVLGFVPEQSLTLVTVEDGELGCVMRADLSGVDADAVAHMAELAGSSCPDAAVAVIVDGDGAACRMCLDDHRDLIESLEEELAYLDIELRGAYVVDRLEAGGRWRSVDDRQPGSGIIEDPMSSPMAAAAVLDGRRLYTRRSELQDVIAIVDPARAEELRTAMQDVEHDGGHRPDADARRDVERALAMARALAGGVAPSDDDLVGLGCGFTDPRVRDTLYALAVGCDADRAEQLWVLMARTLPDPWRVEALVLLAFSAYARGDGPLAGMSLLAALQSDGDHRMARMLDKALQTGMRPDQIRELAQTGYRQAKRLGVRLPPRQGVRRRAG